MLRRWLQVGAGVVLAAVIIGYASFQFQAWWAGPTIHIIRPQDGQTMEKPVVQIAGTAKRIAYLSLNGRQIYTNPQGKFTEKLVLSPGYNVITVSAEDKFNRTTKKQLELILSATSTDQYISNGQE